jgi:hypothetical protein
VFSVNGDLLVSQSTSPVSDPITSCIFAKVRLSFPFLWEVQRAEVSPVVGEESLDYHGTSPWQGVSVDSRILPKDQY